MAFCNLNINLNGVQKGEKPIALLIRGENCTGRRGVKIIRVSGRRVLRRREGGESLSKMRQWSGPYEIRRDRDRSG
ncbi:hypothetical protein OG21DRAFT_1039105 [Imleria badia]|nr:hypothetical protein OG21DRAFT_1039105 [Imleria badia]